MTCPYCGSNETGELPMGLPPSFRKVSEGTHGCWECGKVWIRLGPHPPVHKTYEDFLTDGKEAR